MCEVTAHIDLRVAGFDDRLIDERVPHVLDEAHGQQLVAIVHARIDQTVVHLPTRAITAE